MPRALLITGATGKQGGSVISALLARKADFQILAVTRDPDSSGAKRLAAKSPAIALIKGDLDHVNGIFTAAAQKATSGKIWGVFSVQSPGMNKSGPAIEESQGKALIDAALAHGVQHFVYSSVDRHGARSIDNPTNIPHFISKHHIEHHLIDRVKASSSPSPMTWTILRPVAFMENFVPGMQGQMFATAWRDVVKSRPLQLIATEDIGAFVALSFSDPQKFHEQAISLAGDELTWPQLVEVFEKQTGAPPPTTWSFLASGALWMVKELGTMFAFFEREGYGADVAKLREVHPGLKGFEEWLGESAYARK